MSTSETLVDRVRQLRPWHQNIQLTEDFDIRSAFSESEQERSNNENVALVNLRGTYRDKIKLVYPDGLHGKRFLDCACNAGGYCFWSREFGAEAAFGFDVRQHWINQANFIKEHRTAGPTDNIQFAVSDLMDIPGLNLEPVELTLFKGIFYHLADPISGLKIAADLTTEVLWVNSAVRHDEDKDCMFCNFESVDAKMSGVHSLSWIPSGPRVLAMMLFWLGFKDVWHTFSRDAERNGFGRTELIASRIPDSLGKLSEIKGAFKFDHDQFTNALPMGGK